MENGEINKSVLNLTKKIITQIDSFIDGKFSKANQEVRFKRKKDGNYEIFIMNKYSAVATSRLDSDVSLVDLGALYLVLSEYLDKIYESKFGKSIEYYERRKRSNYEKVDVVIEIKDTIHGNKTEVFLEDYGCQKDVLNQIMQGNETEKNHNLSI